MRLNIPERMLRRMEGRLVFAGFSGGADSLALLLLLDDARGCVPFTLEAVHFDHGLRGRESAADARWCRRFCKDRGIVFQSIKLDVPGRMDSGETIESAARRMRLEEWRRLNAGTGGLIALGHNSGDRVENLLLRLFRGSNSSGLSSMRRIHELDGMTFIRPLLDYSRAQIESWLRLSGAQEWRTDSSNLECRYKRNFIRNQALPSIQAEMPFAIEGMQRSLKAIEDDADFIERSAAAVRTTKKPSVKFWLDLHPALRCRVLRRWLSEALGHDFIPDSRLIERFDCEMERHRGGASGKPCLIPLRYNAGQFMAIERGRTVLRTDDAACAAEPFQWDWGKMKKSAEWGAVSVRAESVKGRSGVRFKDNWSCAFDAALLPKTLVLSAWEHGERMTPFGRNSPVKLKELFSDCGVSSHERKSIPVMRLPEGTPVWIPGVRRSDFAPVTSSTSSIVAFHAEKIR